MQNILSLPSVRRYLKRSLVLITMVGFFSTGILTATADSTSGPAFNAAPDDNPTIAVKLPSQDWPNSPNKPATSLSVPDNEGNVDVMIWDHNSQPDTIAHAVNVKAVIPSTEGTTHTITGTVSSAPDNISVTGTATLTMSKSSTIALVPGSVQLLRVDSSNQLSGGAVSNADQQALISTGINLGDQQGCYQFTQVIIFKIHVTIPTVVTPPPAAGHPKIAVEKAVGIFNQSATNDQKQVVDYGTSINATPGEIVAFRIGVQNIGDATGLKPHVVDTVKSPLTYRTGRSYIRLKENNVDKEQTNLNESLIDKTAVSDGSQVTWAFFDTMDPKPEASFWLVFEATIPDASHFQAGVPTNIVNCASAYVTDQVTGQKVTGDSNCVTITVTAPVNPTPVFHINKSVQRADGKDSTWYDNSIPGVFTPGDMLAFRINVSVENAPANNLVVKDILPAGLTATGDAHLVNIDTLKQSPDGQKISNTDIVGNGYTLATVNPPGNNQGNAQTLYFVAKVNDQCSGQQTLTNIATLNFNGSEVGRSQVNFTISCTSDLSITKDIKVGDNQFKQNGATFHEGDIITYHIVVANSGTTTAKNPIVSDVLPQNVSYVPNSLRIDGVVENDTQEQSKFFNHQAGVRLTDLGSNTGARTKVITFDVKVNTCPPLGTIDLLNAAYVHADGITEKTATADATVIVRAPHFSTHPFSD